MEEIKVGEFARINKDFRIICLGIGKVVNINQNTIYIKMSSNDLPIVFNVDSIAKHSPNIIDLIEVGDYVNGCEVIFDESMNKLAILRINQNGIRHTAIEYFADKNSNEKIESIVTHEQFNSIKYEVI